VIFDRDGTIIDHVHHLVDKNEARIKDDLLKSLNVLKELNFRFGIITNQSVISRGLATLADVDEINNLIKEEIKPHLFDFIKICPHTSKENCNCRKPKPQLGLEAIREFKITLCQSYYIGDSESDVQFASNIGFKMVRIVSSDTIDIAHTKNVFKAKSLIEAANFIAKAKF
jgi:D-glycero-D-manno-heptose 1,7-bisphosphate phosphatase